MALIDGMTPRELADLIYTHASAIMTADIRCTPPQAQRRAVELAVVCYEDIRLAQTLRDAAQGLGLPKNLANLIAPEGGATLALAKPDMSGEVA